jgi:hypothetical protein
VAERPTAGLTLTDRQSVCQLNWLAVEAGEADLAGEDASRLEDLGHREGDVRIRHLQLSDLGEGIVARWPSLPARSSSGDHPEVVLIEVNLLPVDLTRRLLDEAVFLFWQFLRLGREPGQPALASVDGENRSVVTCRQRRCHAPIAGLVVSINLALAGPGVYQNDGDRLWPIKVCDNDSLAHLTASGSI